MRKATDDANRSRAGRAWLRLRKRWRAWLRSVHRDAGYLAVGLTFVYAISGIALDHVADWNANFKDVNQTHQLGALPKQQKPAEQAVLAALGIKKKPEDAYMATKTELEIELPHRTLHADLSTGKVFDEWQKPRFFLRVANWIHAARGKKAWTYFADGYALMLLLLATSGAFMLKGRKGLLGRGGVLILIGAAAPILYVHFSGGP